VNRPEDHLPYNQKDRRDCKENGCKDNELFQKVFLHQYISDIYRALINMSGNGLKQGVSVVKGHCGSRGGS
jgi:hypothetical protein